MMKKRIMRVILTLMATLAFCGTVQAAGLSEAIFEGPVLITSVGTKRRRAIGESSGGPGWRHLPI